MGDPVQAERLNLKEGLDNITAQKASLKKMIMDLSAHNRASQLPLPSLRAQYEEIMNTLGKIHTCIECSINKNKKQKVAVVSLKKTWKDSLSDIALSIEEHCDKRTADEERRALSVTTLVKCIEDMRGSLHDLRIHLADRNAQPNEELKQQDKKGQPKKEFSIPRESLECGQTAEMKLKNFEQNIWKQGTPNASNSDLEMSVLITHTQNDREKENASSSNPVEHVEEKVSSSDLPSDIENVQPSNPAERVEEMVQPANPARENETVQPSFSAERVEQKVQASNPPSYKEHVRPSNPAERQEQHTENHRKKENAPPSNPVKHVEEKVQFSDSPSDNENVQPSNPAKWVEEKVQPANPASEIETVQPFIPAERVEEMVQASNPPSDKEHVRHSNPVKRQEDKVQPSKPAKRTRISASAYMWCVKKYSTHKAAAMACGSAVYKAEYISIGGYIFTPGAFFKKRGYLASLHLYIEFQKRTCTSSHCSSWPFQRGIRLRIIHPKTNEDCMIVATGGHGNTTMQPAASDTSTNGCSYVSYALFTLRDIEGAGYVQHDQLKLAPEVL